MRKEQRIENENNERIIQALHNYGAKHKKNLLTIDEVEPILMANPGGYNPPVSINPGITVYEDTTRMALSRLEQFGGIKVLVHEGQYNAYRSILEEIESGLIKFLSPDEIAPETYVLLTNQKQPKKH